MKVGYSSVVLKIDGWTFKVLGNWVYGSLSGPTHRLDLTIKGKGDAASRYLPHGMVGQSFSSNTARHGKRDVYPLSGRMRTMAMAEGAIEGKSSMYEVAAPFAIDFRFSRFTTALVAVPSGMLMDGAASAVSDAERPHVVDGAASSVSDGEAPAAAAPTMLLTASFAPPPARRLGEAAPCAPPVAPFMNLDWMRMMLPSPPPPPAQPPPPCETFYSCPIGSSISREPFEDVETYGNMGDDCWFERIPQEGPASSELAIRATVSGGSCGTTPTTVEITGATDAAKTSLHKYFVHGTQSEWEVMNATLITGFTNMPGKQLQLWTGAGKNYGWILANSTDVESAATFASGYNLNAQWDYCNSVSLQGAKKEKAEGGCRGCRV